MKADSAVRRGLLWWFRWPSNPYVTVNFAVDFTNARAWLAALPPPRVTIHHLVAGAIARTLAAYPVANARIVGDRIVPADHVGIAMPVSLLGHGGEESRELGMAVLERAETRTLREVAEATTRVVSEERRGAAQNPFIQSVIKVIEASPTPVVSGGLSLLDRMMRRQAVAERVYGMVPVTTGLSNAGAAIARPRGMLFRGADIAIPQRLVHIGTFWGTSAIQDEVIAVDGAPAVRPMLPVLFLFDHRLIDGVMAARVITRFGEIVMDPAKEFGSDGSRRP
jgi:pyruvate/2-oxoglutarate dehydrogenase complex dihydrolipoamide acyltransferase (E2) component